MCSAEGFALWFLGLSALHDGLVADLVVDVVADGAIGQFGTVLVDQTLPDRDGGLRRRVARPPSGDVV